MDQLKCFVSVASKHTVNSQLKLQNKETESQSGTSQEFEGSFLTETVVKALLFLPAKGFSFDRSATFLTETRREKGMAALAI